jgi:hypothetical protein
MDATFRVTKSFALALMVVALADAGVSAQTPKGGDGRARRQARCFSDSGTVRACLVPESMLEGRQNIQIGNSGCYWLKEDEKEKKKQYKRSANGRPRQFAFQVINLCTAPVKVRLDLAVEGTLRFQTARCESRDAAGAKGAGYIGVPLGEVAAGQEAVTTCDTLPYRSKWWFGDTLRREFRLAVTTYAGSEVQETYFDPEVVLEKAGH